MHAVIAYLDDHDPAAATRARARCECLQPYAGESAAYGQAVLLGVGEPCRRGVIEQLVELRRRAGEYLLGDGIAAEDEYFFAEQNAAVVANAEEYYRTMFGDRTGSWNLRDRHMADTLDQLSAHLDRRGGTSRIVVWAHNSHVGDARATEMVGRGELRTPISASIPVRRRGSCRHQDGALLCVRVAHERELEGAASRRRRAQRLRRLRPDRRAPAQSSRFVEHAVGQRRDHRCNLRRESGSRIEATP
jgi:hypothetical protein